MRNRALVPLALALALLAAACNDEQAELSTTSSLITGTTEAAEDADATTTTEGGDVATTTLRGETVDDWEVRARISSDNGETLYIVIPPGAYTDIDLEGFVGDLKESDPQLYGAEVFDDEDAMQAFLIPEEQRTEGQQQLLDDHHLVSLVGGNTIVFRGPFEEFGEQVIGS